MAVTCALHVIARGTFSRVDPLLAAVSLRILVPDPGAAAVACVNDAEIGLGNPLMEKAIEASTRPDR